MYRAKHNIDGLMLKSLTIVLMSQLVTYFEISQLIFSFFFGGGGNLTTLNKSKWLHYKSASMHKTLPVATLPFKVKKDKNYFC